MNNSLFSTVPVTRIARSWHNLSHQVKSSFNGGALVPILTELSSPGSTWHCPSMEQFIRSMPMIAPVMDRVDVKADAFFIPLRLIWDDFEDFITLGPSGEFNVEKPTIGVTNRTIQSDSVVGLANSVFSTGGLADYLNFPYIHFTKNQETTFAIDALPFRAYQLLYNEYYRNEALEEEIPIIKSSGHTDLIFDNTNLSPASFTHFLIQYRGWRKDYFTSALPYPQKGPAVRMPQSSDLTIKSDGNIQFTNLNGLSLSGNSKFVNESSGEPLPYTLRDNFNNPSAYLSGLKIENNTVPPTIEELRYAETLQEFYEANARGGSRYKEYLLNIWHTRSKDARLDRPERIGGYRGPLTISDIDQTSQSDISPQATPAGKGLSSGSSRMFKYKTSEWGIFMVILSVQPKTSYYQGFRKWNLYNDVFDWPNPFFANLGEQEIKNLELYFVQDDTDGQNNDTFGYTPRFAEAKFIPDSVHGQFRDTLDYWHLARKFSSRPHLNKAFVHVNPLEMARIFPDQVEDDNKFIGTFYFHLRVKMHLPYYGVPRLIHSI